MGFVELPDHRGLLYVPGRPPGQGKHDCPDCHVCQHCSDDRCGHCRGGRRGREGPRPPTEDDGLPPSK